MDWPWTEHHSSNTKQLKPWTSHLLSTQEPINDADSNVKRQTAEELNTSHLSQPVHQYVPNTGKQQTAIAPVFPLGWWPSIGSAEDITVQCVYVTVVTEGKKNSWVNSVALKMFGVTFSSLLSSQNQQTCQQSTVLVKFNQRVKFWY